MSKMKEISKEAKNKLKKKLASFKIKDTSNAYSIETFETVILGRSTIQNKLPEKEGLFSPKLK
ncbi:MAG: hypothetical protein KGO93_10210 [Cyanobacteria bacterium REEB446]|jgi:hypothetical protein|nr:hypothetical protein [Cyanobacteria bacterium REEB446]